MINFISIIKLITRSYQLYLIIQLYLIANFILSFFPCLALNSVFQMLFPIEKLLLSSLSCPPYLTNWTKVAIIAIYVIVLLVIRPTKWIKYLFVLLIILGLIIGFLYSVELDLKTIKFDDHIYVKGQLTERAKAYLEKNPPMTEKEYFNRISRDPAKVWTPESIEKNKLILGGLYSLIVGIIGFGILGALEIIARSNSAPLQSVSGKMAKNQKTSGKQDNL